MGKAVTGLESEDVLENSTALTEVASVESEPRRKKCPLVHDDLLSGRPIRGR